MTRMYQTIASDSPYTPLPVRCILTAANYQYLILNQYGKYEHLPCRNHAVIKGNPVIKHKFFLLTVAAIIRSYVPLVVVLIAVGLVRRKPLHVIESRRIKAAVSVCARRTTAFVHVHVVPLIGAAKSLIGEGVRCGVETLDRHTE